MFATSGHSITAHSANIRMNWQAAWPCRTAPVSHQKQPDRNATNAIEIKQKYSKINEADR